jgi:PAP2 superfamily
MGPLVFLYIFYTLVRWAFADRATSVGDHNAKLVLDFQRWLRIDQELWIQTRMLPQDWLVAVANDYYVFAFFPVLIFAVIVGALRAPAAVEIGRQVFAISLSIALVSFALFPLTPPRLLGPEYGFVDTLMLKGPHYYGNESGASIFNLYGSIPSMVNEHAAMPSMHVGWSAIAAAILFAATGRRRIVAALGIIHVSLMELVVVATGNHYIVDGLIGLLVVVFAYAGVRMLRRVSWQRVESRELAGCEPSAT